MMAVPQQNHIRLFEDLPPELLDKIFELCTDDVSYGRKALVYLSVMNKYFRDVIKPRLFQQIRFHDLPESPGDEILHSIRQFMATPELMSHARTVSLHLKRGTRLGADEAALTEPYHHLILPELFEALVKMPNVTELYIEMGGWQERRCLQELIAAAHWCSADLNITALSVSFNPRETFYHPHLQPYDEINFLEAFPHLKTFCFEGRRGYPIYGAYTGAIQFHSAIASNLTQLRICKTYLDPHLSYGDDGWDEHKFWELELDQIMPEPEYLSLLGELNNVGVSSLLELVAGARLRKLKYVDITDEQTLDEKRPILRGSHLAEVEHRARNHPNNENRSEVAGKIFQQAPQLRRICFIRCRVGEVFLRGYQDPVANSTGYISSEINDADLVDIPARWCHGVPQTSLLRFPEFTRVWEDAEPTAEEG